MDSGRYAYEGLDRILHERARLGILTSLMAHPKGLRFADLKAACQLTDGNLNRHLAVLEEASLIEVWKGREERRPRTLCRLTPVGRDRFQRYLNELEAVIRDATVAAQRTTDRPPGLAPA